MLLTVVGFVAPYLLAFVAFPLVVKPGAPRWPAPFAICLLIVLSPWLVPASQPFLRFLASLSAVIAAVKVVDGWLDARLRMAPTGREYAAFLANPFVHVRRCLPLERRPAARADLSSLAWGSLGCACGIALLTKLQALDWHGLPFLVEHVSKVLALMLAITSGLAAAAALWRLSGGAARDYMDKPFTARTPADFWRRYNRNMHQFLWHDVFKTAGGRRAPLRTTLLVFALSAFMHELVFVAAVGRVQGYQSAFFSLQGLAALATARVRVAGWATVPWVAATLTFNLLSAVLFFASIHAVIPFYSRGLPQWLQGW